MECSLFFLFGLFRCSVNFSALIATFCDFPLALLVNHFRAENGIKAYTAPMSMPPAASATGLGDHMQCQNRHVQEGSAWLTVQIFQWSLWTTSCIDIGLWMLQHSSSDTTLCMFTWCVPDKYGRHWRPVNKATWLSFAHSFVRCFSISVINPDCKVGKNIVIFVLNLHDLLTIQVKPPAHFTLSSTLASISIITGIFPGTFILYVAVPHTTYPTHEIRNFLLHSISLVSLAYFYYRVRRQWRKKLWRWSWLYQLASSPISVQLCVIYSMENTLFEASFLSWCHMRLYTRLLISRIASDKLDRACEWVSVITKYILVEQHTVEADIIRNTTAWSL